jgi:hypothetical protein
MFDHLERFHSPSINSLHIFCGHTQWAGTLEPTVILFEAYADTFLPVHKGVSTRILSNPRNALSFSILSTVFLHMWRANIDIIHNKSVQSVSYIPDLPTILRTARPLLTLHRRPHYFQS